MEKLKNDLGEEPLSKSGRKRRKDAGVARQPLPNETKQKISASTKGRVPHNKGKTESIKYVYYTDGKVSIRIPETITPPSGFVRGRLKRKLTQEEKDRFNKKREQTCIERYGNPNYNNTEQNKRTKQERYGDSHYNNREQSKQTCLTRYGVTNPSKVKSIQDVASKHSKESAIKNGTINYSKPEEMFYKYLIEKYGADDVIRQYKDDIRYPFFCDFYIKSIDTFIELNIHWCHGFHPFDDKCEEDLSRLSEMKHKDIVDGKHSYGNAIKCWTVTDPMKQRIAKDNNLNYIVFYSVDELLAHISSNA